MKLSTFLRTRDLARQGMQAIGTTVAVHESESDAVDGSSTGTRVPKKWALFKAHESEELPMQTALTIGLDIAKSIFQVHGVDGGGQVVIRRQLKRRHVSDFFPEFATMPDRHGGVRFISLLVARAPGARPQCSANATKLREALR
jgi:hypothetical protein